MYDRTMLYVYLYNVVLGLVHTCVIEDMLRYPPVLG